MKTSQFLDLLFIVSFSLVGCASIPSEAPKLSMELGKRINALQESNITLLHRFFDMKRERVDQFIQDEWLPVFAEEVFSDPQMQESWNIIVSENNSSDRLRFLVMVGPQLQKHINTKRNELIKPLNDIERDIYSFIKNKDSFIKILEEFYSITEVANYFNISRQTVHNWANKFGVKNPTHYCKPRK